MKGEANFEICKKCGYVNYIAIMGIKDGWVKCACKTHWKDRK